jgi:hypothetical protein
VQYHDRNATGAATPPTTFFDDFSPLLSNTWRFVDFREAIFFNLVINTFDHTGFLSTLRCWLYQRSTKSGNQFTHHNLILPDLDG